MSVVSAAIGQQITEWRAARPNDAGTEGPARLDRRAANSVPLSEARPRRVADLRADMSDAARIDALRRVPAIVPYHPCNLAPSLGIGGKSSVNRPVSTGITTTVLSRAVRANPASHAALSQKAARCESLVVVQAVADSSTVAHPHGSRSWSRILRGRAPESCQGVGVAVPTIPRTPREKARTPRGLGSSRAAERQGARRRLLRPRDGRSAATTRERSPALVHGPAGEHLLNRQALHSRRRSYVRWRFSSGVA